MWAALLGLDYWVLVERGGGGFFVLDMKDLFWYYSADL